MSQSAVERAIADPNSPFMQALAAKFQKRVDELEREALASAERAGGPAPSPIGRHR